MTSFTRTFGGTAIRPSSQTYLELSLSENTDLVWPIEQLTGSAVVADILNVAASTTGLSISMPDARKGSNGYSMTVVNSGANNFTVRSATGSSIVVPEPGTAWIVYLTRNTTEGGSWGIFQLGATTAVAQASALAGQGLTAVSGLLNVDSPVNDVGTSPYAVVDTMLGAAVRWMGGVGTFTFATRGNGWHCYVYNGGSGALTLDPDSGTIDGASTKILQAGEGCRIFTNGTDWFTIASGGGSGGSSFDYTSLSVAGTGNYTLSGAELDRISYNFTGVLTGTRTIIVPASVQQYWISNNTTGAFSLYVKTAGQAAPGVEVLQSTKAILYCDGTNVVDADTGTVTFPIAVAQGGTGGTTQAAARTGLGASAVGDAVFTAVTQATALTALGAPGLNLANTFTQNQLISLTSPRFFLNDSSAAANNRKWGLHEVSTSLYIGAWSDDETTSSGAIRLDRSGTTITGIYLWADSINLAGKLTSTSWISKLKISSTSRTSTTTLSDDPNLTATILAGQYTFKALLLFGCASDGSQGFKFSVNCTDAGGYTAYTVRGYVNGSEVTTNSIFGGMANGDNGTVGSFSTLAVSSTTQGLAIEGYIYAPFGGTLSIQWAQNSSNAAATTLYARSFLVATRVAS